jgi:hypothetical protein
MALCSDRHGCQQRLLTPLLLQWFDAAGSQEAAACLWLQLPLVLQGLE